MKHAIAAIVTTWRIARSQVWEEGRRKLESMPSIAAVFKNVSVLVAFAIVFGESPENGCGTVFAEEGAPATPVPAILSTDLSLDRDPDDWFDTLLFLTLPGIEPRGIVLEHYATDEVMEETKRFLAILGFEDVPVAKGVQGRLMHEDDAITARPYHDGAELILRQLEQSEEKIALIAVGGLTNEALAFQRRPKLFEEQVRAVYFAGGNLQGQRDTNVARDTLAVQVIFKTKVPVVWSSCSDFHKQKLTGEQEREIAALGQSSADFLTDMLARWRKARPQAWLQGTEQLPPQGKNLWSLPIFIDILGQDAGALAWARGHAHFSRDRWTWFETDPNGPDRMLLQQDGSAICQWLMNHLRSLER